MLIHFTITNISIVYIDTHAVALSGGAYRYIQRRGRLLHSDDRKINGYK